MRQVRRCVVALEGVDVECTHCGVRMTARTGSGGAIRYFNCPSCHRWVTSQYPEVFRVDAKVRTREPAATTQTPFAHVRERLERFLGGLDANNPFAVLGVSPADTEATIRERYRELARTHHPDAGGSDAMMSRLNAAYEQVLAHKARQRGHQTPALASGM